ncbi:hypothetical protein DUNSADRAFT_8610 [Dunaliella salina]|uniref:Uncharacterized protein n=1 Tax=Dunaliella salina TaxID=3046 RepID=A0ABQ7H5S6_DUNSA|nr:hypothetical protein DUNSADRAFT_8610 [Dunaliella salina]|eukprot:KAF5842210.1 hypothetical protein DUNSADRAFT_8610 [Dunaliella salina]
MLFPATKNATGSYQVALELPSPEGAGLWQALCAGAIIMNISLFAFNLLVPAYPLDGGRMFVDMLLVAGVGEYTAAKITIGIAVPIGVAIIIFGGVIFQMVTILVGCFILYSTYKLWTYVSTGTLLQHPMFSYTEQQQEPFSGPVSVDPNQPPTKQPAGVQMNVGTERLNTAPLSAKV